MSQRTDSATAIKKVRKAIEAGDKAAAQQVFQASMSRSTALPTKKSSQEQGFTHKSRLSLAVKTWPERLTLRRCMG